MPIETIDITLSRVIYNQPNKFSDAGVSFVIAKGQTPDGETVSIKGEMSNIIPYESYRLFGEMGIDEKYNEKCFKFRSFHVLVPLDSKGAAKYFSRYIKSVGPVSSNAIIEFLGPNAIDKLISTPDLVFQVPGLSKNQSEAIAEHFRSNDIHSCHAIAELTSLFSGFDVPHKVIESIVKSFGSSSLSVLSENPYILISFPRIGWDKADAIARKCFGIGDESPIRIIAAVREAMTKMSDEGHTCCIKVDLEAGLFRLIGSVAKKEWFDWACDKKVTHRENVNGTDIYQLRDHFEAERDIALNLARLTRDVLPINVELEGEGLEGDQLEAFRMILSNGVSIVAGIPGSGKTYTVAKFCNELEYVFPDLVFTFGAPTGKAAKRIKELLDYHGPGNRFQCSTIHKILRWAFSEKEEGVPESVSKPRRGRARFQSFSNEEDGLPIGAYVIEEASMCDIFMMSSLLRSIPSGSRVIIIGDPYQLSSIRAGAFLRDCLAAEVPNVRLELPRRNAGRIVRACCDIKSGQTPRPSVKFDLEAEIPENWIHIERSEPRDIQAVIVALHEKVIKEGRVDPFWDIQVISPQHEKSYIGCNDLNEVLSKLLNPKQADILYGESKRKQPFSIGDKVIRKKNGIVDGLVELVDFNDEEFDWTDGVSQKSLTLQNSNTVEFDGFFYNTIPTPVVNGDMGLVLGSVLFENTHHVIVELKNPTRIVMLPLANHKLQLSFASTVHSMQGSSAKIVIAPISDVFYAGLVSRELIYTTLSRAEEKLITIGSMSALKSAIGRQTINFRKTRLRDYIQEVFAERVWSNGRSI